VICYHTTTRDRLASIMRDGLLPNSEPTWFCTPAPYVMLGPQPWPGLNGEQSVVLEIDDPAIPDDAFADPETGLCHHDGLWWPHRIAPEHIRALDGGAK